MITAELIGPQGNIIRNWNKIKTWDTDGKSVLLNIENLDETKEKKIIFTGANSLIITFKVEDNA